MAIQRHIGTPYDKNVGINGGLNFKGTLGYWNKGIS